MIRFVGHGSYALLAKRAAELVMNHAGDTVGMTNRPFDLYELVREKIPYVSESVELLKAPAVTLQNGGDCDDKTILICAWAQMRGISWRMVLAGISTENEKYHHIFPELKIDGVWITFDATYPYMKINTKMKPYNVFIVCMDNEKAKRLAA